MLFAFMSLIFQCVLRALYFTVSVCMCIIHFNLHLFFLLATQKTSMKYSGKPMSVYWHSAIFRRFGGSGGDGDAFYFNAIFMKYAFIVVKKCVYDRK